MTHADLEASLARMDITVDAAEAHGWLAGALCVREGYGAKEWLAELAADAGSASGAADPALRAMPEETLAAFRSDGFEFAPLLPPEQAPLAERVAALAAWSAGFLYGVGTGASRPAIETAGDVGEFLGDLADISRVALEPGRDVDAGEADFAELYEFVRAGTQLTYDTLAGARDRAQG
jgi:uncharacterized protein